MTAPRPCAPRARPASASTTTLIVAAVVLVAAVVAALVLGGRGKDGGGATPSPPAAPAAPAPETTAPGPGAPGAETLPDRSTGIAACDELIGIIRCAQPRLEAGQQEAILKGGMAIMKAIAQVRRMGQQVPELAGQLETACKQGTGQLRTTLAGLPPLAPCLQAGR